MNSARLSVTPLDGRFPVKLFWDVTRSSCEIREEVEAGQMKAMTVEPIRTDEGPVSGRFLVLLRPSSYFVALSLFHLLFHS